ncbi:proline-rich receptor-like protein kinase PERK2 isoform X6 [Manihot esculenta]|uniref:proline-rich receptor-like protein kinase PERK2 isoform X6 n=1 Tax=Manihot esculenta TaxID=3983 RepID=UPI001CC4C6E3|nr:proline-rich receptor-like protein kinase PERK2 isoform X6 [Manihot esculenta]
MDTRDPNESGSSSSASENYDGIGPKSYSYDELAKVTGHFSHNNLIGRGGFGHVFRASLDGETRAIKRLDYPGVESEGDLEREIMVVKSISHKNLVELIGYCIDGANRLLILKYFPNGSLRSKLDGKENVLDWKKRMNIAIGSARGLEYLHEHCKHKIIHLDIKPDNILLDEHFEPKANLHIREALDGKYANFVDSKIQSFDDEEMHRMVSCINSCLNRLPKFRPTMEKIRLVLEGKSLPEVLYDHNLQCGMIYKDENTIGPKSYSYGELARVTDHFSLNNQIGRGSFGHVFKASLDGEIRAIKRLDFPDVQFEEGLEREIMVFKSVRHKNLVELVGYCIHGSNRLLISKYFPNGSLRSKLHGSGDVLDWKKRMKIAIGSAKGLEYLHEHCNPKIIHLNMKPDNIFLDEDFEPKITDFGLAQFFTDGATHISKSSVMGTHVYEDPLTTKLGKYSDKSDIYSFGVTLLELIMGRKPIENGIDIVTWANRLIKEEGRYTNFVDFNLQSFDREQMYRMISCVNSCLNQSPNSRPTMKKEADEPKPSLKPFIMEETNNYGIRDRGHASRRPTEATSYGSSHIIPETSFDEMNMLHLIKTLNISSYF